MASIKKEERFEFPGGPIWVLADSEWGVEVCGQNSQDGDVISMLEWDFNNSLSWNMCFHFCCLRILEFQKAFERGDISEETVIENIYALESEEF